MASKLNSNNSSLMAPPTPEELQLELFTPPTEEELKSLSPAPKAVSSPVDAPPTPEELGLPAMSQEYAQVRKTIERPFFDANIIGTETTTEAELSAIAKHHGVSPQELSKYASFFGAQREKEEPGLGLAGAVSRGVGLNLPQFVVKKMQTDPNFRKALDDVQSLGDAKRSQAQGLVETLAPGGLVLKAAEGASALAKMGKAALAGAGTGTAVGLGRSEEGKELEGAAIGAGAGGILGGAVGGVVPGAKYLFGKKTVPKVEAEAIEAVSRNPDIQKGIDEVASATRNSEAILERVVATPAKRELSLSEAVTILEEQVSPKRLERLMSDDSNVVEVLSRQAGKQLTPEEAVKIMADNIVDLRLVRVANELSGSRVTKAKDAAAVIQDYVSRQGKDGFVNKYRGLVELDNATKYLQKTGERIVDQPGFVGKVGNFISDHQFVLNRLDSKYNLGLGETLSNASAAFNRSTYPLGKFRSELDSVFKEARKLGTDKDLVGGKKIYNAIDTGNYSGLSEKEIQTANKVRNYFAEARTLVNSLPDDPNIAPLSIPERANYIPKAMVPTSDAAVLLETKLQEVAKQVPELAKLSWKSLKELSSKNGDLADLIQASEILGKSVKNGRSLINNVAELASTRRGNLALETKARAAIERGEVGIPDFLLEKNVYKLMDMWVANTLRHVYLRNSMDKLTNKARILEKAGADVEAQYIRNVVKDILGVRSGTAAEAALQAQVIANRKLDLLVKKYGKDSVVGGAVASIKAVPDMLNSLNKQIYGNVLGDFSLRAPIQNATALFTKVAPEIGGIYGYQEVAKGVMYTALNFRRLSQKTKQLGTVPEEFIRKGEQAIAEGIQRSALYQVPAKALEGMGRVGMVLYQASEKANRAIVLGLGELMAKEIAAGKSAALRSLKEFPPSVRNAVSRATSTEEIGNIIGKHLNDVTQYNYNRLSMSEFGRFMGPFFSTFSKWPTATAGEIIYELETKGALRGSSRIAEKFIAPLVLLQVVDTVVGGERMGEDDSLLGYLRFASGMGNLDSSESSDRFRKIAGSKGLSQAAPIGSIAGVATGEIFTPPAVDAIFASTIKPALEGDSSGVQKGLASIVNNFIPRAGMVRFLTDDMVTYLTGERPEGSDFFERTAEGARIIDSELSK